MGSYLKSDEKVLSDTALPIASVDIRFVFGYMVEVTAY